MLLQNISNKPFKKIKNYSKTKKSNGTIPEAVKTAVRDKNKARRMAQRFSDVKYRRIAHQLNQNVKKVVDNHFRNRWEITCVI